MDLQRYVTEVLEAAGALVQPVDYALCQVLVPDCCRDLFQGRDECLLAFDFETAQENPTADFVTFGSHLLDALLRLPRQMAISLVRHVIVDKLALASADERIARHLNIRRAGFKITSERAALDFWVMFMFRIAYLSDERVEQIRPVWIDLASGECLPQLDPAHLFHDDKALPAIPVMQTVEVGAAFMTAWNHVRQAATEQAARYTRSKHLDRELIRITDYYEDLQEENQRLMGRKGISAERSAELADKAKSLILERDRQIHEMRDKYEVKPQISLDHAVLYTVPTLEYTLVLTDKGRAGTIRLNYNSILKRLSRLADLTD
jgi:hypothetical protein